MGIRGLQSLLLASTPRCVRSLADEHSNGFSWDEGARRGIIIDATALTRQLIAFGNEQHGDRLNPTYGFSPLQMARMVAAFAQVFIKKKIPLAFVFEGASPAHKSRWISPSRHKNKLTRQLQGTEKTWPDIDFHKDDLGVGRRPVPAVCMSSALETIRELAERYPAWVHLEVAVAEGDPVFVQYGLRHKAWGIMCLDTDMVIYCAMVNSLLPQERQLEVALFRQGALHHPQLYVQVFPTADVIHYALPLRPSKMPVFASLWNNSLFHSGEERQALLAHVGANWFTDTIPALVSFLRETGRVNPEDLFQDFSESHRRTLVNRYTDIFLTYLQAIPEKLSSEDGGTGDVNLRAFLADCVAATKLSPAFDSVWTTRELPQADDPTVGEGDTGNGDARTPARGDGGVVQSRLLLVPLTKRVLSIAHAENDLIEVTLKLAGIFDRTGVLDPFLLPCLWGRGHFRPANRTRVFGSPSVAGPQHLFLLRERMVQILFARLTSRLEQADESCDANVVIAGRLWSAGGYHLADLREWFDMVRRESTSSERFNIAFALWQWWGETLPPAGTDDAGTARRDACVRAVDEVLAAMHDDETIELWEPPFIHEQFLIIRDSSMPEENSENGRVAVRVDGGAPPPPPLGEGAGAQGGAADSEQPAYPEKRWNSAIQATLEEIRGAGLAVPEDGPGMHRLLALLGALPSCRDYLFALSVICAWCSGGIAELNEPIDEDITHPAGPDEEHRDTRSYTSEDLLLFVLAASAFQSRQVRENDSDFGVDVLAHWDDIGIVRHVGGPEEPASGIEQRAIDVPRVLDEPMRRLVEMVAFLGETAIHCQALDSLIGQSGNDCHQWHPLPMKDIVDGRLACGFLELRRRLPHIESNNWAETLLAPSEEDNSTIHLFGLFRDILNVVRESTVPRRVACQVSEWNRPRHRRHLELGRSVTRANRGNLPLATPPLLRRACSGVDPVLSLHRRLLHEDPTEHPPLGDDREESDEHYADEDQESDSEEAGEDGDETGEEPEEEEDTIGEGDTAGEDILDWENPALTAQGANVLNSKEMGDRIRRLQRRVDVGGHHPRSSNLNTVYMQLRRPRVQTPPIQFKPHDLFHDALRCGGDITVEYRPVTLEGVDRRDLQRGHVPSQGLGNAAAATRMHCFVGVIKQTKADDRLVDVLVISGCNRGKRWMLEAPEGNSRRELAIEKKLTFRIERIAPDQNRFGRAMSHGRIVWAFSEDIRWEPHPLARRLNLRGHFEQQDEALEKRLLERAQDMVSVDNIRVDVCEQGPETWAGALGLHNKRKPEKFQLGAFTVVEENDSSVLVTAPTGAGKTDIALALIYHILRHADRDHGDAVVFVCPTKALCRQMFAEITSRLHYRCGRRGERMVGMVYQGCNINKDEARVLLTVPQLLHKWLAARDGVVRRIGGLILDEVHFVLQQNGWVWENILLMLAPEARFVALSATIPNARNFSRWLSSIRNDFHLRRKDDDGEMYYTKRAQQLADGLRQLGIGEDTETDVKLLYAWTHIDVVDRFLREGWSGSGLRARENTLGSSAEEEPVTQAELDRVLWAVVAQLERDLRTPGCTSGGIEAEGISLCGEGWEANADSSEQSFIRLPGSRRPVKQVVCTFSGAFNPVPQGVFRQRWLGFPVDLPEDPETFALSRLRESVTASAIDEVNSVWRGASLPENDRSGDSTSSPEGNVSTTDTTQQSVSDPSSTKPSSIVEWANMLAGAGGWAPATPIGSADAPGDATIHRDLSSEEMGHIRAEVTDACAAIIRNERYLCRGKNAESIASVLFVVHSCCCLWQNEQYAPVLRECMHSIATVWRVIGQSGTARFMDDILRQFCRLDDTLFERRRAIMSRTLRRLQARHEGENISELEALLQRELALDDVGSSWRVQWVHPIEVVVMGFTLMTERTQEDSRCFVRPQHVQVLLQRSMQFVRGTTPLLQGECDSLLWTIVDKIGTWCRVGQNSVELTPGRMHCFERIAGSGMSGPDTFSIIATQLFLQLGRPGLAMLALPRSVVRMAAMNAGGNGLARWRGVDDAFVAQTIEVFESLMGDNNQSARSGDSAGHSGAVLCDRAYALLRLATCLRPDRSEAMPAGQCGDFWPRVRESWSEICEQNVDVAVDLAGAVAGLESPTGQNIDHLKQMMSCALPADLRVAIIEGLHTGGVLNNIRVWAPSVTPATVSAVVRRLLAALKVAGSIAPVDEDSAKWRNLLQTGALCAIGEAAAQCAEGDSLAEVPWQGPLVAQVNRALQHAMQWERPISLAVWGLWKSMIKELDGGTSRNLWIFSFFCSVGLDSSLSGDQRQSIVRAGNDSADMSSRFAAVHTLRRCGGWDRAMIAGAVSNALECLRGKDADADHQWMCASFLHQLLHKHPEVNRRVEREQASHMLHLVGTILPEGIKRREYRRGDLSCCIIASLFDGSEDWVDRQHGEAIHNIPQRAREWLDGWVNGMRDGNPSAELLIAFFEGLERVSLTLLEDNATAATMASLAKCFASLRSRDGARLFAHMGKLVGPAEESGGLSPRHCKEWFELGEGVPELRRLFRHRLGQEAPAGRGASVAEPAARSKFDIVAFVRCLRLLCQEMRTQAGSPAEDVAFHMLDAVDVWPPLHSGWITSGRMIMEADNSRRFTNLADGEGVEDSWKPCEEVLPTAEVVSWQEFPRWPTPVFCINGAVWLPEHGRTPCEQIPSEEWEEAQEEARLLIEDLRSELASPSQRHVASQMAVKIASTFLVRPIVDVSMGAGAELPRVGAADLMGMFLAAPAFPRYWTDEIEPQRLRPGEESYDDRWKFIWESIQAEQPRRVVHRSRLPLLRRHRQGCSHGCTAAQEESGAINERLHRHMLWCFNKRMQTANLNYRDSYRSRKSVALLIRELQDAHRLPAILFLFNRESCEELASSFQAQGINVAQPPPASGDGSIEAVLESFCQDSPSEFEFLRGRGVIDAIRCGIGVHHAGVPDVLKTGLEDLFRRGHLKLMVATSTLAVGIHLPCHTVVFLEPPPRTNKMQVSEFRQMAGRAGRRPPVGPVGNAPMRPGLIVVSGRMPGSLVLKFLAGHEEPVDRPPNVNLPGMLEMLENLPCGDNSEEEEELKQQQRKLLYRSYFLHPPRSIDDSSEDEANARRWRLLSWHVRRLLAIVHSSGLVTETNHLSQAGQLANSLCKTVDDPGLAVGLVAILPALARWHSEEQRPEAVAGAGAGTDSDRVGGCGDLCGKDLEVLNVLCWFLPSGCPLRRDEESQGVPQLRPFPEPVRAALDRHNANLLQLDMDSLFAGRGFCRVEPQPEQDDASATAGGAGDARVLATKRSISDLHRASLMELPPCNPSRTSLSHIGVEFAALSGHANGLLDMPTVGSVLRVMDAELEEHSQLPLCFKRLAPFAIGWKAHIVTAVCSDKDEDISDLADRLGVKPSSLAKGVESLRQLVSELQQALHKNVAFAKAEVECWIEEPHAKRMLEGNLRRLYRKSVEFLSREKNVRWQSGLNRVADKFARIPTRGDHRADAVRYAHEFVTEMEGLLSAAGDAERRRVWVNVLFDLLSHRINEIREGTRQQPRSSAGYADEKKGLCAEVMDRILDGLSRWSEVTKHNHHHRIKSWIEGTSRELRVPTSMEEGLP